MKEKRETKDTEAKIKHLSRKRIDNALKKTEKRPIDKQHYSIHNIENCVTLKQPKNVELSHLLKVKLK